MPNKCCYIWDETLLQESDRLPAVEYRASMVHGLIAAYGLLEKVQVVRSAPASYDDLKLFHSELYLEHLKTLNEINEDYMTEDKDEDFGIGYDCPPVSNMFKLVTVVAGSSVTAAKSLLLGVADVAINWCGGWHHAHRFGAEGFCYVNDIVICIERLRQKFLKVLYVDLDVHHGNGVQDAYNLTKSVFTLSFHKYEPGFFPGTGGIDEIGILTGKGFMCNVPLHGSYNDETFEYIFDKVFHKVYDSFEPDALVIQCGADALSCDPNGGAGLTIKGYCASIQKVLDKRKPTVLLGGGGYNHTNTAKLWTAITALVVDVNLDQDIPEHDHWPKYGPDFVLNIKSSLVKDENTKSYLDECIHKISDNLEKYVKSNDSRKHKTDATLKKCDKSEIHMSNQFKKYKKIQSDAVLAQEHNVNDHTQTSDVYKFSD
ncbi:unnamed protein product [Leptosia nina]|uniref:Histone deacetylase n=1 Tax=Leptosia nina TaxID=320188 RepID=A0AAV1IWS9_9NEOP